MRAGNDRKSILRHRAAGGYQQISRSPLESVRAPLRAVGILGWQDSRRAAAQHKGLAAKLDIHPGQIHSGPDIPE